MGQCGWELLALAAMQDGTLPDAYFEPYVARIEEEIHRALNRTRYAMSSTLSAIGLRSTRLRSLASASAGRIGLVVVDYGQTGCRTQDAVSCI